MSDVFKFKQFSIEQTECSMKVGTDGVLLGAWVEATGCHTILDIGTGTGVIALMQAQKNSAAKIIAVEIDDKAAQEAQKNVRNSRWANNITVVHQSIQDFANQTEEYFDHIISNPPFFTGGTLSSSQNKTDVRHTIKLSHNALLGAVRNLISPQGSFSLILPDIEGYRCIELAKTYNLYPKKVTEVYPDQDKPLERLLISFGKSEHPYQTDTLYIRDAKTKDFSQGYKSLTKDFYLKF